MEEVTQDLDQLRLDTPEEISTEFNKVQEFVLGYEESCGDQTKCTFEDAIKKLQQIQNGIINQAIFSPNEDFEEIQSENLKYLLLPFYIGDVFGRMTEYRKKNLEFSRIYLLEFLKLLDHYGLVSEKLRDAYKSIEEKNNYEPTREEKIQQFKDQKELENKIRNLDKIQDENIQRDAVKTQCMIYIYKAIDSLKSMVMEFEILDYKEKIQNDEQAKKEHEDSLKRPLPKLKHWSIPKQEKKDQEKELPYLLSQAEKQALCHDCAGKTYEELKQMKQQEVFRPDVAQPTVRLEELADMYMADMAKMEEQKSKAEEEQRIRKENVDSDHEDEYEKKRLEDSRWDDWKDENEKGAGNRMGK